MLFKDHLKLVTDAGAVLHLGWNYNAPYNLDPLNGVDVDIQTAQGINQTGTTVERQSVAGVSRTLSVVFWGGRAPRHCPQFRPQVALLHHRHDVLRGRLLHPLRGAENALFFQLHRAAL